MSENDFQVVWLSDGEIYVDINFLVQSGLDHGAKIPMKISKQKLNSTQEKRICKFINGENNVETAIIHTKEKAITEITNLHKFISSMCEDRRILFFELFLKTYKKFCYYYPKYCNVLVPSTDFVRSKTMDEVSILLTVLYNLQHNIANTLTCNNWMNLPTCTQCHSYIKVSNIEWLRIYYCNQCKKKSGGLDFAGNMEEAYPRGIANEIFYINILIHQYKFAGLIDFNTLNELYGSILRLLPDININYPKTLTQKYLLQIEMPSVLTDIVTEYLPHNED